MANLRKLLGKEFGSTVLAAASEYASLSKVRDGKVFNMYPYCNISKDNNYRGYCMEYWCMPCGTTQATFEIWGGGGSGAGGCCCQQGIPGGSGSYSRKTITSADGYGDMGGWCFYLNVAQPTDCSASCLGIQGCKTYVCGTTSAAKSAIGSNFCAEGGVPGKTCCEAFWSSTFRCQDRVYWTGCGGYDPATDGATAYGGDENVKGNVGFFRIYNTSDNCWAKLGLPYPARLMDHKGGHIMATNGGNACINDGAACQGTTPFAFASGCSSGLPGIGAPSTTSCGGSCCYGWKGNGGFIKITYCSCWLGVNEGCAKHFCN
jgi:hypothetical protein